MDLQRHFNNMLSSEFWHENSTRVWLIGQSLTLIFIAFGLINFTIKLVQNRRRIVVLRDQGLPIAPEWNWLTGNLLLLAKLSSRLPQGLHKTLMFADILRDNFKEEGCCYIDLWPVSYPCLLVMDPVMASQTCQTAKRMPFERPKVLPVFFKPVAGGLNLFDLPSDEWKPWRTIFNKGFSTETLYTMVPSMLAEAQIYHDVLLQKAQSNQIFELDTLTLRYTMSLIGRTVLNTELGAQTGSNPLADGMMTTIAWMMPNREINPLEQLNFVRDFVHWYYGRQMNRYTGAVLDQRYHELQGSEAVGKAASVMDLVLEAYLNEQRGNDKNIAPKLDPAFRAFAITQIRLFLFVGHDSLSTTICYAIYLLAKNPKTLEKLRAEHDSVSTGTADLSEQVASDPKLVNNLPYTHAVIKETLRLFPPGSATRQGYKGINLTDSTGKQYPLEDMFVWILHVAMHKEERYWVDADQFIPERWLVEPGHRLYPEKDAWRAFEWGPRSCIGQNLAMMEMKLTLAMIARDFDFTPAYEEQDKGRPAKATILYRNERAWLMERGAAHPADMMPCRVKLRGP